MAEKSVQADLEMQRNLYELKSKLVETNRRLQTTERNIGGLKFEIKHAELTERELNTFHPDTAMYQGMGRIYIRKDRGTIYKNLRDSVEVAEGRLKRFEATKENLVQSLKETEASMRELIQQWKKKDQA